MLHVGAVTSPGARDQHWVPEPKPQRTELREGSAQEGASMVAVPSGVLGPLSGSIPCTQLEGGTRQARHAAQPSKYLYNIAPWPATRQATCRATAMPHGMSPMRNDFMGSLGHSKGSPWTSQSGARGVRGKGAGSNANPAWNRRRAAAPLLLLGS